MNKVSLVFDKTVIVQELSGMIISESGAYSDNKLVLKNDYNRKKSIQEYEKIFHKTVFNFQNRIELEAFHTTISRSVFIPLAKWISIIDIALENNFIRNSDIITIPISTKSPHICVLEAEGESQGSFFYNSHYFLPYYIEQYLKNKGFNNIKVEVIKEVSYTVKRILRGFAFIHLKFIQQLIYKFYNIVFISDNKEINENIIATRGIIQTHFSKNILSLFKKGDYTIVVNESSIFPFRNLKYIKSLNTPFIYIEGNIPFWTTLNEYGKTLIHFLKYSITRKKQMVSYLGLEIDVNRIITEVFIFKYYSETQGLALKQTLKNSNIRKNIFCFDMLTPQPYYVKKHNKNHFTAQIQTTLMAGIKQENFVFTDKFFFTDIETYNSHNKINSDFNKKFDVLQDLKYASLFSKEKVLKVDTATFFTQPVFLNEEFELIKFLKQYCAKRNIKLKLKLHPRSSKKDYNHFNIEYIDSNIDSITAISISDLTLTRNSTIGLDSWKVNVPVLFFLSKSLTNDNISYIPDDYKGTFKELPSSQQLDNFIENMDVLFYDYNFLKVDQRAIDALSNKFEQLGSEHEY